MAPLDGHGFPGGPSGVTGWDSGGLQAVEVHGVAKSLDMTEWLN